jgi:hypothetical protein
MMSKVIKFYTQVMWYMKWMGSCGKTDRPKENFLKGAVSG